MDKDTRFDFQVISLPRSGTMWMANFLSYGTLSLCIHEPESAIYSAHAARLEVSHLGNASSAMTLTGAFNPKTPTIRIKRNFNEAWQSFSKFTNLVDKAAFARSYDDIFDLKIDSVLDVEFRHLTDASSCGKVWSFLFPFHKMPRHHHAEKSRMRITTMDTAQDTIKIMERRVS